MLNPRLQPAATAGHLRLERDVVAHPEDVAVLEQGVAASVAVDTREELRELASFIRDEACVIRGGVYGWTWGGCCELQYLWVEESLRGNGLGGLLAEWAEREARSRGCGQVVLFTHASRASTFYLRRGYDLVGRVDDYPVGDSALWLRKALA
jgi:GNAT superfamily N-acetyltransferase